MQNFRELTIWQKALILTTKIYELTHKLPEEEKFGLKPLMRRSARSIAANIADGCSSTNNYFNKFLGIAIGSSFELETDLLICQNLNFLNSIDEVINELRLLQKQMSAFRKSLVLK